MKSHLVATLLLGSLGMCVVYAVPPPLADGGIGTGGQDDGSAGGLKMTGTADGKVGVSVGGRAHRDFSEEDEGFTVDIDETINLEKTRSFSRVDTTRRARATLIANIIPGTTGRELHAVVDVHCEAKDSNERSASTCNGDGGLSTVSFLVVVENTDDDPWIYDPTVQLNPEPMRGRNGTSWSAKVELVNTGETICENNSDGDGANFGDRDDLVLASKATHTYKITVGCLARTTRGGVNEAKAGVKVTLELKDHRREP